MHRRKKTSKHGPLKCGTRRQDGFIFWGYSLTRGKVIEMWYSPERFEARRLKIGSKSRDYRRDPRNAIRIRSAHLEREHGITLQTYNLINAEQKGLCAICGKPETIKLFQNLAVDHCHRTGKVRGLLCNRCNTVIGRMEENVALFRSAIAYLQSRNK